MSSSPTTTLSPQDADIAAAKTVVESLNSSDLSGFDPETWAQVADPNLVLPPGSQVSVVPGTWVMGDTEGSVDVVVSRSDAPPQRHWVFLRKLDGRWVVYATMPLEVGS